MNAAIEAWEPHVNAFTELLEGGPGSAFEIAVKDVIWMKGLRATRGSRAFADYVCPADAVAVQCWYSVLLAVSTLIGTVLAASDRQRLLAILDHPERKLPPVIGTGDDHHASVERAHVRTLLISR